MAQSAERSPASERSSSTELRSAARGRSFGCCRPHSKTTYPIPSTACWRLALPSKFVPHDTWPGVCLRRRTTRQAQILVPRCTGAVTAPAAPTDHRRQLRSRIVHLPRREERSCFSPPYKEPKCFGRPFVDQFNALLTLWTVVQQGCSANQDRVANGGLSPTSR